MTRQPCTLLPRTLLPRTRLTTLLVVALLVLASGCRLGDDDEMVPPSRTVSVSPSPATTAAPATVPVGHGIVSPGDVVWAQGSVLHVAKKSVDLAPVGIDAFVVVPGGIFLVYSGELWFTDLSRVRGTGLVGVTGLGVTADATRILVTGPTAAAGSAHAYDTGTGSEVSSEGVVPVTADERRQGPDRSRVPVPKGFELAGWAGTSTFYGVAGKSGHPRTVVSCDRTARTCTRLGRIEGSDPVLFGTGAQ